MTISRSGSRPRSPRVVSGGQVVSFASGQPLRWGQLPKDDIQVTGRVEVKSGDRFRVVPPRTFGTR
jgi:hypothetical protein